MAIRMPFDLHDAVVETTGEGCFGPKCESILYQALEAWLAANGSARAGESGGKGYQWKQLFLPDGTMLRTCYQGKTIYGKVDDGEIVNEGSAVSPSQFANQQTGGGRNAWKHIWLRFPHERAWRRALNYRHS